MLSECADFILFIFIDILKMRVASSEVFFCGLKLSK